MELQGKTINFLGDSITFALGVKDQSKTYFNRIKEKYCLAGVNAYGIPGTRFAIQIGPSEQDFYDKYFASRVDEMADADAVVVFGGTNDFGHGDAPIGTFSDRTSDTFYGACHELFTKLIEKYPGKPIVIMTPLHRKEEDEVRIKHGVSVTLKTYVDIIREVAEAYSLPVCDMFKNSLMQPAIPVIRERFMRDGLHPNEEGHELIAERLGNFLKNL